MKALLYASGRVSKPAQNKRRMEYNPDLHHRRSIRLRGYDYSRAGAYFVTVCTQGKRPLLGEIVEGKIVLNEAGRLVGRAWEVLPRRFPHITLDIFVAMPNHVHGIIMVGAGLALPGGAASSAPTLGDIVRAFKSTSAVAVNALHLRSGEPLWQRNYYDHIIRNGHELNKIREYISTNPPRWASDPENLNGRVESPPLQTNWPEPNQRPQTTAHCSWSA